MSLEQRLDAYTVTFAKSIEDDGYVARYRELGYSARGVGRSKLAALHSLRELVLDTMADVPEDELPQPGAWEESAGP